MGLLFTNEDLASWLQIPEVDNSSADRARRYASGWLSDATGIIEWPDPVPDRLWTWGIELGGIAYNNPEGAASENIDDYRVQYDATRREQILDAARVAHASSSSGPQWSFPKPDWSWSTTPAEYNRS